MDVEETSIQSDSPSNEPTLKEKTAKGFFWGGISNGVQLLLGMIFGIVIARALSPEDYGLINMLAIFTGISTIIINSGFSVALTNNLNATHKDYNAVFWFSFLVSILLYFILYFCAPLIAAFYDRPELTNLSRVIFISFFFSAIGIVPYTVLFKKLMVKQQALIDITAISLSGIIGLLLAINGFNYWALAIQAVLFICIGSILRFIIAPWRPTLSFDFSPLNKMLSFSSKLFLTNIFQQIHGNFFTVMFGKFYDATQLGYYSQGSKWMSMLNQLITGMFNIVAQPVIVQVNNDKERQMRVIRKMTRLAAFIAFPAFLGLIFIAKEFILVTIGEKFLPSVIYLQIMCGWGIVTPFIILYTQLLISHGKSNIFLKGNLIIGGLQISMIFVLFFLKVPIIQILICYVLSYCLSFLYWYYWVDRLIGVRFFYVLKDISPYAILTILSIILTAFLLSYVENVYLLLIGKILLTATIYIAILWISNSKILHETISLIKRKQ